MPDTYPGEAGMSKDMSEHVVISVNDDEETLIFKEESRSKMLDKQNDPISIEKKINISPIDYSKLNNIKDDFGKRFVTQKELDAEQAFWLKHSNQTFVTPINSHTPVRIEAPSELPKEIIHIAVNFVDILDVNKSCVNECSQSQEKDTVIRKLKDRIKSLMGKESAEKVKNNIDEIETINIELEHNSNKKTRIRSKEHSDSLIALINPKSIENSDLNAQLQEKVFAIAA
ncbi:hypothetical protein Tco_0432711 [Tanacetum coccineum]